MPKRLFGLSLLGLAACSATTAPGSDGGGDGAPSAAATSAFAQQFATAFSNGMSSVAASRVPASANIVVASGGEASAVPVNQQVTARTNCTAGGRIEVNGSLTGNIDETGSGVLLLQVLETITDWRCIGGFVINGDPYLSVAGSMSFQGGRMSSPASFDFGGGWKWGPPPGNGWQVNMTAIVNPDGSGRISGVIGPYNINVTF